MNSSIGELIRKAESDYVAGTTQSSKYVNHSMFETLETIDAYLNSKHLSGETDSLGREKPFFNIVVSAANIWYRATDIDRKHIVFRAAKSGDYILSFVATIHLQRWMRKENFGMFLNEWGRVLSRYGSAVTKFVVNKSGLHAAVIPWNRIICDAVDFDANPKIEILELTEAELRKRIQTHGYIKEQVEELVEAAKSERETLDKQKKDTKSDYFKLYEIHGILPRSYLTGDEKDENDFVQQMQVVSFVGTKKGRKIEYQDFTLFKGEEAEDPYMITHLIKEDGRTLSIGAVEHLFDAQWMVNHSQKSVKDTLDIASKAIYQTSDPRYVNRNVIKGIESGDIMIHAPNQPLTQLAGNVPNLVSWQNFSAQWKQVGNEIVGISDAMLGAQPKAGTAWRQTEALLNENYSLFEFMTENKGLYLKEMFTRWIFPHVKKQMDTKEEITATLDEYGVTQLDELYVPREAIKRFNRRTVEQVIAQGENALEKGILSPIQPLNPEAEQNAVRQDLTQFGNQRFYTPDDIGEATWKKLLENFEDDIEIDITGETKNTQEVLTTLNNALRLVMTPGYDQNKKAQKIVGKALELTGAMSPLELAGMDTPQAGGASVPELQTTPATQERNI